jgi:Predicted AAA-ATPase/PD-(D/E)XK nuclease superfamily
MEKNNKLPIGVQDFQVLRTENSIYVDKTEQIYHIIQDGNYYFLSRPRRFGKSLLLSTIKELFKGNKSLFEGLWIEDKWDWTQKNPVVHISFAAAGVREIGLIKAISYLIERNSELYGIALEKEGNPARFRELIQKLYEKHGKVVVLIDEYDKAIVDYIDDIPKANEHKEILRDFYVVLKDTPEYLRFVFITGISKFSKVSIFSALNHLNDISMDDKYATLLGYTQEELEYYFESYIPRAAKANDYNEAELLAAVKYWYNGYSWDGSRKVYNPFSILNFFDKNDFKNFWFSTGTPTFLSILARQQEFYDIDAIETEQTAFETFDIENLNPQAVMFQTGYLTIKKHDRKFGTYTLGYPNNEVRRAFLEYMIDAYSFVQINDVPPTFIKIRRALERNDIPIIIELLNTMFASIPYQIWDGTSEKYYHSLVHLMLNYLGTNVQSEISTNRGRLDAVLQTEKYIYILEFKFNKSAQTALRAIEKRGYAQQYAQSQKEVIAVGINFSSATKNINQWRRKILIPN